MMGIRNSFALFKTILTGKSIKKKNARLYPDNEHDKVIDLCVACLLQASDEDQTKNLERLFFLIAPKEYIGWLELKMLLPIFQREHSTTDPFQ